MSCFFVGKAFHDDEPEDSAKLWREVMDGSKDILRATFTSRKKWDDFAGPLNIFSIGEGVTAPFPGRLLQDIEEDAEKPCPAVRIRLIGAKRAPGAQVCFLHCIFRAGPVAAEADRGP
jgi:hypothetical protein